MSLRAIIKTNGSLQKKPFCGFCKRNGEMPQIYEQHILKDSNGKVVCPNLRKHICELCGATGDEAHTRSYCPFAKLGRTDPFFKDLFRSSNSSTDLIFNNMVSLKKSRVNSAGRVRRY